jgi:hypothetical protein
VNEKENATAATNAVATVATPSAVINRLRRRMPDRVTTDGAVVAAIPVAELAWEVGGSWSCRWSVRR